MTKLLENETFINATINLLTGGTPCQSFSLAGLRTGLADDRGNLSLQYCRLLIAKRPRWFIWENVPGVLNSFSGEAPGYDIPYWETSDFATILSAFRECGYSCCWRVLDSQFFGVPQRRRRVFVVGHLGDDWRPPFAVLFEPNSMPGNFAPMQKTGPGVAGTINASSARSRGAGTDPGALVVSGTLDTKPWSDVSYRSNLIPCWWDGGQISQTLDAILTKYQTMPEKNRFPVVITPAIGFDFKKLTKPNNRTKLNGKAQTIDTTAAGAVSLSETIRRLTPLECERLQGFPDNYTAIPGAADAPRYKAIGNSQTTLVMQWLGRRIDKVDKILQCK